MIRSLARIAASLTPWQALRVIFDRDYTRRVTRAADAAEALAEVEAEQECWEPHPPAPDCCPFHEPARFDAGDESTAEHDGFEPWGPDANHVEALRRNAEHDLDMASRPIVRSYAIGDLMSWMSIHRRTDISVRCGHCLQIVGDSKAFAVHLLTCDLKPTDSPTAVIPPTAVETPDPSPTVPRSSVGGDGQDGVSGSPELPPSWHPSFRFARFFGDR